MAIEAKIKVENPVVELDGDEMTRIIWKKIREEVRLLLRPLYTIRLSCRWRNAQGPMDAG